MRNAEDGGDPARQSDLANAAGVTARVEAAMKFVDTEILELPDGTLQRFLAEQPALAVHRTDLDNLASLKRHAGSNSWAIPPAGIGLQYRLLDVRKQKAPWLGASEGVSRSLLDCKKPINGGVDGTLCETPKSPVDTWFCAFCH